LLTSKKSLDVLSLKKKADQLTSELTERLRPKHCVWLPITKKRLFRGDTVPCTLC